MKKIVNVLKRIGNSLKNLFLYLFAFGKTKKKLSILEEEAIMSPTKIIIRNFRRNKLAMTGLITFMALLISIFSLAIICPIDISVTNGIQKNVAPGMNYLIYPKQLEKEGVKTLSSGNSFSVALSNEGNVFVWGANTEGVKNIPVELSNHTIVDVSAGSTHIIAMTSENQLIGWGFNNQSQAIVPESKVAIFTADPIAKVMAGDEFTAAITQSGKLHVWGATMNRQLNLDYSIALTKKVVDMSLGTTNIVVLYEDGTVQVVGGSLLRYPDPNDPQTLITPEQVRKVPDILKNGSVKVVDVQISTRNGLALDDNGNVYVWGDTSTGLHVAPEGALQNIKQIGAGRRHMAVLTNDGQVITWGDNSLNQTDMPKRLGTVDKMYITFFQNYVIEEDGDISAWGNRGYLFGTDDWGRDVFIRIIHGGRISMTVGAVAVIISVFIGVTIGMISGFYGKWVDMLLMRFAEIVASFPFLPLAITLSVIFGGQLTQNERLFMIMFILGVLSWTGLARLVRGQILSEREKDFVLAAKATGIRERHIITRHILPNIINIVIVSMTLGYAGSLLTEAGLSYLGFGVIPPSPSWGNMLTGAQSTKVMQDYWWRWMIPGFSVIIAALSVNLVGDGLREAMDPKANER